MLEEVEKVLEDEINVILPLVEKEIEELIEKTEKFIIEEVEESLDKLEKEFDEYFDSLNDDKPVPTPDAELAVNQVEKPVAAANNCKLV